MDLSPTAEARNAVAHAVDVAHALIEAHGGHSAHWPDEITEAVDTITTALVGAGVGRGHAGWATTKWLLTRRDIWECVAETDEHGVAGHP